MKTFTAKRLIATALAVGSLAITGDAMARSAHGVIRKIDNGTMGGMEGSHMGHRSRGHRWHGHFFFGVPFGAPYLTNYGYECYYVRKPGVLIKVCPDPATF